MSYDYEHDNWMTNPHGHGNHKPGETSYHKIDGELGKFFWQFSSDGRDTEVDRKLDQFEEIWNYGLEKEDPAWIRIVQLGSMYELVGQKTVANDVWFKQKESVINYQIQAVEQIILLREQWDKLVPVNLLSDIIFNALRGDTDKVAEILKQFESIYTSAKNKMDLEDLIYKSQLK